MKFLRVISVWKIVLRSNPFGVRDDHEPHEPRERSADDALDLRSSGAAEVHEQADTQA